MNLAALWFIAIAVLWTGYFFLEGFDFGVGMLLPVLGRSDAERGALIETIGGVWDGNEVWLIVAAGATFAAFPPRYARPDRRAGPVGRGDGGARRVTAAGRAGSRAGSTRRALRHRASVPPWPPLGPAPGRGVRPARPGAARARGGVRGGGGRSRYRPHGHVGLAHLPCGPAPARAVPAGGGRGGPALSLARATSRYAERLASHDAAFRVLRELRVAMWKHLERIAPAGLPTYRSGDLLARLVADVDAQQDLFLRVALPYAAAGVAGAGAVALLWWLLSAAGVAPAVALLLAAAAVPWLAARIGRRAEQRVAPLRGELSDGIAELLRGAPDLLACRAAGRRLDRVAGIDRALRRALAGTATAAGLAAGRVTLNGVDIRALAGDDVRRVLGLCAQDAHVFDTSVGENVLLARRSAGPGEVRAALAGARLLDWVDGLPDGTATAVGEHGSRVSGGERQRLALARTLLADRPVLLLDEPTEHLDLATADPLAADLVCAAAGRTTLLVTHRLATLAEVDEIVVLDAGQVVERGTHAGLLAARGPYRRMWDLERDAGRFSDPVAVPGGGGGTSAQAQVRSPLRSWARSR